MHSSFITIIAAIVLMALVVVLLGIGWLITGKSRLRKGCGYLPKKGKDEDKSCQLCGNRKTCEEEKKMGEDK